MRTLGLIGGMSWESTVPYYRHINRRVQERLGGHHSARLVLASVDFAVIERLQHVGDWAGAEREMIAAARSLQAAGAECVVLCTNTMHRLAEGIAAAVPLPLLHIADYTAAALRAAGHARVGLLGTRFTMEQPFYRERLRERHGIEVLVPPAADRELVHRVIYEELCHGTVREESRREYRRVMAALAAAGAEAVVLGCTEISLLVGAEDASVPLFDTTAIHALGAADWALEGARDEQDDDSASSAGAHRPAVPGAAFARALAEEWIAAWNSHDLERILRHYRDDFSMSSPRIPEVAGEVCGVLHGKPAVAAYWRRALELQPTLRFELLEVYRGTDCIVLRYNGPRGETLEALFVDAAGRIARAAALAPAAP